MATRQELEQALNNPNVRKYLDFIASSEGVKHGYNTIFGNERFNNLGAHPNVRKEFTQTDGKKNYTTAAGRYQFLNGTWGGLQKQYGFRDFSPQSQDLGAIALIAQRGALNDVMSGNWSGATGKLGKEWASLPSSQYKQGKRSQGFADKFFGAQQQSQSQSTPQFLSAKDEARLFPQNKPVASKPNYLNAEDEAKLFPQNNAASQKISYLTPEQEAQLFPRG